MRTLKLTPTMLRQMEQLEQLQQVQKATFKSLCSVEKSTAYYHAFKHQNTFSTFEDFVFAQEKQKQTIK